MKINKLEIVKNVQQNTLLLLKEKGIKGWNMQDLADICALSKDTLYRLIGNKENWIEKVIVSQKENHIQEIILIIIEEKTTYEEKLQKIFISLAEFASELSTQNIKDVFFIFPNMEQNILAKKNEMENEIIAFIELGKTEKYFRKNIDTKFIVEMMNSNIVQFLKTRDSLKIKEDVLKALSYLLKGVKNV